VTGSQESVGVQQRLDELRRCLYRDGATEEDLRRYAEERAALSDDQNPLTEPFADSVVHRSHRLSVAASAGAIVLLAGIGIAVTARPAHPWAVPTPAAHAAPLTTSLPQAAAPIQEANVVTSPPTQVVVIDGTAATAQQYEGMGDAVVVLDMSSVSLYGARGMVMLSSTRAAPIAWSALRLAVRRDWTSYEQVVAHGTVAGGPGGAAPIGFDYVGSPPSRIAIEAPSGTRWTVVVAFLSGSAPPAR
jgi:hypothetical protein